MEQLPIIQALFLGNYLSAQRGTIGPSEILAKHLQTVGIHAILVSAQEAKLYRAADMLLAMLSTRSQLVCADVFSGNILNLLPIVSLIAQFRKKPLVLVLHGGQLPELFEKNPVAISKVFRRATLIVTPSLYLKQYFEKQGFNIQYLPNPVQLEHFPYAPPPPAPKLLWIRAFAEIYNPALAIDTLVELRRTHPEASLTMIGPNAGTLDQIRIQIAKKGLDDAVKIIGPISNNKLAEHHRSHSVFLNTTAYESFGSAVLEAAASGIPIVSASVGNISLLWKNEHEILFAQSLNAFDFAEKIRHILREPALTRQRSENARKKAEQFDIQFILPQWRTLFDGILER